MAILLQKLKTLLMSILFYPIFIVLYSVYSIGCRMASLAQYIFTFLYIQQICGFRRKEKIVNGISEFSKVPENVTIVYEINRFVLDSLERSEKKQDIQDKIINQHLDILSKVNAVKTITLYVNSESQFLGSLITNLEKRLSEIPTQKQLKILTQKDIISQQTQILTVPHKTYTPFLIVFSNYESVCDVPAKYLVNAQIAFNSSITNSTNYDIYRAFGQYAESKQRNGK